ncbi:glycoside hydrolase [Pseudovirgaria hyperparasitica]|uniref:Beta-mannosidase A n=1 Tax=Pseudovirgaria hyperparasitica TaxID=470096 RepID=A0A6A6WFA1_9PEZI|nr:glycoside hydrolase [Pseudovirgaria hyperparasitica]KAF2760660.1 glycoside hydrolase [Pseudovirgaria hyperparasitica]
MHANRRNTARAVLSTALIASQAVPGFANHVIDLSGDGWTLSSTNSSISVPAKLPGQAHLDLYAAQVIGDPYYGLNDFNLRWIAWSNWTYTSDPIQGLQGNASSTWLRFDGLDTFTSISFCNEHVAATNNQFRQYWFDVSDILQACTDQHPVLSIEFGSAPNIINAIATKPDQRTWPDGIQIPFEFDNRQWVRKEGSDFGWDWGPAFAPAGPWKPVYVVQLEQQDVHVRNSVVDIYRKGQLNNLPPDQTQPWVLNASMDFFGTLPEGVSFVYTLLDAERNELAQGELENVNTTNVSITGSTIIPSDMVELWWPVGLGKQSLYHIIVDVLKESVSFASIEKRVGFRTIIVNSGPIRTDQLARGIAPGDNWHFEVNGHEFYAKGSNFIPPDTFWTRVDKDRISQLFDSVVDGRQNMLRVWSTGAYSPDFMYDLADEYGILLWSEFEFGDAMYPVDPDFLNNVREEAVYQVRRVNHHPSLAFWAGGNEMENLILFNYVAKSAPNKLDFYIGEYEALFLNVLTPAVFENSKSISYQPSSTSNGYLKLDHSRAVPIVPRYMNLTEGSIYGETDYYNYDSTQSFNVSGYPVGRFSNEFGFHSMPSIQSWRQAVHPNDLHFNSSVIMLRDHHPPSGSLNTSNFDKAAIGQANFTSWIYATQIFQADFYKSQIQHYRRGSGMPERQLGCLYWQLEDQWQAPTWAGIEYDGRWKYTAKDIYKNVIIAPHQNDSTDDQLEVYVTSDLWSSTTGRVNMTWYDWSGIPQNIPTATSIDVTVDPLNTSRVYQTSLDSSLSGHDRNNLVLIMDVTTEGKLPNDETAQTFNHRNWYHPTPLKDARLVDPGLKVTHNDETKKFTVEATTGVAVWTWLDYPEGVVATFDDNAFVLRKGETREVGYRVKKDTTSGNWIEGVKVGSLWDNTTP